MVVLLLIYVVLYLVIDHQYIGSSLSVVTDSYNNILLVFLYGIIGIVAIMELSKKIRYWKPLNYIGNYSILFYFLNGGALTILSAVMKRVPFMDSENYLNQIFVAILATALMFPCVWFINKYLPLLSGNKESFEKLAKQLKK